MVCDSIYIYNIRIKTYNGVLNVANIDTVVDKIQQKSYPIICGCLWFLSATSLHPSG